MLLLKFQVNQVLNKEQEANGSLQGSNSFSREILLEGSTH